jgi:glucokinase
LDSNQIPITIGIDIGGTNTAFGFVLAPAGKILAAGEIPTRGSEPAESLIRRLREALDRIFNDLAKDYTIAGIGIGAPNGNYYRGTVEHPPNLAWGVVDLAGLMRDACGVPVAVTNDANAAALGELRYGAARGMRDFLVITLGTGLGSGIVVNGEVVYGSTGFAGELGHTTAVENGRPCGCGKRGCLEAYASATGICNTARVLLAEESAASPLRNLPPQDLTSKALHEAAIGGDPVALKAFEETGAILGRKLADAVTVTSPEAIFLHGGLARARRFIFEPTARSLEKHLPPVLRGTVRLLPSGLPERTAALLGASALVPPNVSKSQKYP